MNFRLAFLSSVFLFVTDTFVVDCFQTIRFWKPRHLFSCPVPISNFDNKIKTKTKCQNQFFPHLRQSVPPASNISMVKFPAKIEDAARQACDCVIHALVCGNHRINVELRVFVSVEHSRPLEIGSEVIDLVNYLGSFFVAKGMRANFFFNSVSDLAKAHSLMSEDLKNSAKINVLGMASFDHSDNVAVLICPSNEGNENLKRIEAVERILYAGPPPSMKSKKCRAAFLRRPIIMINQNLEAVHAYSTERNKVVPMFMSDFVTAYYIRPHIEGRGRRATGLFKAFPNQYWQIWQRSHQQEEFRILFQHRQQPTEPTITAFLNIDDPQVQP